MNTLLITYDLNRPGQEYTDFRKTIKDYGTWAKLSESSYAIRTSETPFTVYSKLAKFIDKNDHIYVINLDTPYYGQGSNDVNNWLANNL